MALATLSDDLLRMVLEEWLTFEEFVALDTAACNKHFRKCLLRVIQQPLMTLRVGKFSWDTKAVQDYASLRGVTPRQLTYNWNSLQSLPNMHDKMFSRVKALDSKDAIREFAEAKTVLGGHGFSAVSQLTLRQETPWFPPEDVEDEFSVDFCQMIHLVHDQFPSLGELKLSLQDYGCLCEANLAPIHNLRVFHLDETYMTTTSSFFYMINTLIDLPQLSDLSLMCGLPSDCASDVGWGTVLREALQLSESKQFTSLVSLSGSFDLISLLVHLCPQLKTLSLDVSKIYEEVLFRNSLHHLSTYPFQLPLLTDFSISGSNPCSVDDVLNIEHLLLTATQLRTFNASTLGRHSYAINFVPWLTTRTEPLTSLRGIMLCTNVISVPFQQECLIDMIHWLPNVTEFRFDAGRGGSSQQLTLSALKPIEAWTQLKTLQLAFLASMESLPSQDSTTMLMWPPPPPLLLLDIGRFHSLEKLHLWDIGGAVLDDAYWIRVLSTLPQLQEWVWQETMDEPCITSVVCETIRDHCPMIRVIRGTNIWREINGTTLHRLAMSCRYLRVLHVSLPSMTTVVTVQATLTELMTKESPSPDHKLYVLPKVTLSVMDRQSVM